MCHDLELLRRQASGHNGEGLSRLRVTSLNAYEGVSLLGQLLLEDRSELCTGPFRVQRSWKVQAGGNEVIISVCGSLPLDCRCNVNSSSCCCDIPSMIDCDLNCESE